MSWQKWELDLPELSVDITEIIDMIREFLSVIVGIMEMILNLVTAFTDPLAAAIEAIIEKIKETIEGFLEDLGMYVLHVPIRKRLATNFMDLGDISPQWAGDLGIWGEPLSDIDDPGNAGQIQPPWKDASLNDFLVNANRYDGGNYGFFKTVIESLWDEGDVNRPQFYNPDDYIGGVVLLMGVDFDPLGFLDDIWKLFGLFSFGGVEGVPKVPRPKNLQGRAITPIVKTSTDSTGGVFSAFLEWDLPEVPITRLPDLGGIIIVPERYAILRSKNNVNALSANSVPDLMGTRNLSTGVTFGPTEVVYEGPYDPMNITYLDKDLQAEPDDSFYYTIAWKLKGFDSGEAITSDGGHPYEYWNISNVARVTPYPTLPDSTPPDWARTPSIASMFPQFAYFLRLIVAELEKLAGRIVGLLDFITEYVEFLKSEILRYEALVNTILDAIAAINLKFELPSTGVYYRRFKGQGGNDFFIQDLAMSLRRSYVSAPPFHAGDEYVTGIVMLAGGPQALVDSLLTLMGWLFGGETNALTPILEDLDTQVMTLEQQYFEDDMSVGSPPSAETELQLNLCDAGITPAPTVTFNPDMSIVSQTED